MAHTKDLLELAQTHEHSAPPNKADKEDTLRMEWLANLTAAKQVSVLLCLGLCWVCGWVLVVFGENPRMNLDVRMGACSSLMLG